MRRWTIPLWLAIVLIFATATYDWWFSQILAFLENTLHFVDTNSNLIQGLADFVQLILWIFTATLTIFSIIQRKFPPDIPLYFRNILNRSTVGISNSNENLSLEAENIKLKKILYRIYNLQKTDYILNYWKKTYLINSYGDLQETEEISVAPLQNQGQIFFWRIIRGVYLDSVPDLLIQDIKVKNKLNNHRLQIVEVNRDRKRIEYLIILDPPATYQDPVPIVIESNRPKIFSPLIEQLEDQGGLLMEASILSNVEVKILVPDAMEITSFSMNPNVGNCQFTKEAGHSCVIWSATNLLQGLYTYVIQVRKV